ncbi:MAG: hypothetical protein JXR76_15895 [Deltaproteobacteria bacterium]|nr:hypothetical protein [Deltaproteobacteria bacterium]
MPRTACVNLFAFPLQILLQKHREWRDFPVAVVSAENASGRIQELNHIAKQFGIKKNDSYVSALSLCPLLKAQVVSSDVLAAHSNQLVKLLQTFSPTVEKGNAPGVFWLDCSGIERMYQTEENWTTHVRETIAQHGFIAGICVGSSKFGTYAVAKSIRGKYVLKSDEEEQQTVFNTPLAHMDIPVKDLELLLRLGIQTLGELLSLPADSLKSRFTQTLVELHQLASGSRFNPLIGQKDTTPIQQSCQLDGIQTNALGLLFVMKTMLESLINELMGQRLILCQLNITFALDHAPKITLNIIPALPSMNIALWVELLRLKLEHTTLDAGVQEIMLEAEAKPATLGQMALFQNEHRRDIEAANRALARIRARFGEDSVCRPQLTQGHLPSAQYSFVPATGFVYPTPAPQRHALIRRILTKPLLLNSRPVKGPAGIHFGGLGGMAVKEMIGPYIVEGGWWMNEICREYYFAKTDSELLWVYFDRHRRQWFLQGKVE